MLYDCKDFVRFNFASLVSRTHGILEKPNKSYFFKEMVLVYHCNRHFSSSFFNSCVEFEEALLKGIRKENKAIFLPSS